MALRRWKPFLGTFQHIDAAIEASSGDGVSREEFRKARGRIVELLRDAAAAGDDDGEAAAEGLGLMLDKAMEGSLATLRAVPAGRIPALLAAPGPGGLVGAVGALMKEHASERVRALARDVVREWKLSVGAELARARTAMDVLNGISDDTRTKKEEAKKIIPEEEEKEIPCPKKTAVVSSSSRRICTTESYAPLCKKRTPTVVSASNAKPPSASMKTPAAVPAQPPKKPTPATVVSVTAEQRKMDATKRKLQERYQEAEDAKRRRTIQVIKPPRPETKTGQRQSSAHPAMMRARGPAASSTAERRFMKPLSRPIRV